ncbi:MAG: LemA family protein [Candidatus Cryptobacteroides sp.]
MTAIIIIVALVLVLVLWVVLTQRKLVSADEICSNSLSQIGVQLQSRWDALTALIKMTKSYNEHEYNTLVDVIKQRKEITSFSSASDVNAQEQALTSAFSQIKLVAERYPELKADATYTKTMDSLNSYENKVRTSRMVYNDSVTKYNRMVRQFPDALVASMLKFNVKEYLQEVPEKKDMPEINI